MLESNARLDMLVTDIGLPGAMDGHRLASLARDKRENLHILMISGHAELIKEELATDTTHLLRKPFSMDELTAKVKGMLSQPT